MKQFSKMLEEQEEFIYFQYNSDGEANYCEENKSCVNSLIGALDKKSSLKRMKTSQIDGEHYLSGGGSFQRMDKSINELDNSNSNSANKPNSSRSKQNQDQLIGPGNFQTLNKLLQRNPNVTFRLENQKTIAGNPPFLHHKSTVDMTSANL